MSETTSAKTSSAIRAGQTFRERIENDPEARAAWERTKAQMQAYAKVFQSCVSMV
jgi:hypothetical protein